LKTWKALDGQFGGAEMVRKSKIVDPIPSIHRVLQKIDALFYPDRTGNQKKNKKAATIFITVVVSIAIAIQLFIVLLSQSKTASSANIPYESKASFMGVPLYAQGKTPIA
jgi:hypothetical protein